MKIERLIGIITTLQQNKKVTAPYLAEKFEVSRRTINRDIEDICRAGIPIATEQGRDGGISLVEGFSLDTTVFTKQELTAVFTGLKALDSVSEAAHADRIAEKIGGNAVIAMSKHMVIDLASYYKDDLSDKIERIQSAIRERRHIAFRYYYPKGEEDKLIEPYLVVFKWSDWYVFGFCKKRSDFRLYKLRRLWNLTVTEEKFEERKIPEEKKKFGYPMSGNYFVTAIYDASVKYKLVEEYGPHSFTVLEDGRLYAKWEFADADSALTWFLSLGDKAEVTDPPEMVEKIKSAIRAAALKYDKTTK